MCGGYRSGVAAVIRHHLVVMRLFGNFVAVKRRHCRGYWHHLAVMRLFGKFLRLFGGDTAVIRHHLAVMRLFAAIISREGIQPERLNAEGEARVLLAGG